MSKARHKGGNMVKASPKGEPAIAIPGKAVMEESKERSNGFKKGGGVKEMSGGGDCAPARMDKTPRKARGGGVNMRGRSPLSAANKVSSASTRTTH